jgi:flagellum-specific peptidoglycan hydrolase FlgJ
VIVSYISNLKKLQYANMRIPAIILAQGILESGAGRGDLAVSANHFESNVMKVGKEKALNTMMTDQECFRKYNNPSESFKDHALFLTGRPRYSKLFDFSKAIIRLGPRAANCRLCYRS